MTWTYETTGELGVYLDADSDGNIIPSGTAILQKSKTINHVKTPDDNESTANWDLLFSTLADIFNFNGSIRYFRGKAVEA